MASAGKPPAAPDPNTVIQAQERANHYNASNPFGSATWTTGPDGRDTMVQTMSPEMQAMMGQAFGSAMAPRTTLQPTEGLNSLAEAIMSRVGARYGLGTGNANNPTIPGLQNAPHGGGGAFNPSFQGAKAQQAPPQIQMGQQPMPGGMPPMPPMNAPPGSTQPVNFGG